MPRLHLPSPLHRPVALAVLLAAWCLPPAHAGRPLQTEDADVLDPRSCELESVAARESAGGTSAHERSLAVACGVGLQTQLAVAASRAKDDSGTLRVIGIHGKSQLWKNDAAAFTLAYSAAWVRPREDRDGPAGGNLGLVYTRALALDGKMHFNLGHERDPASGLHATTWAAAFEHNGFGPVAPMAEVYGDDRGAPWWNAALRWTVLPGRLFLDGSYGRQVTTGRPRLVTLGAKLTF